MKFENIIQIVKEFGDNTIWKGALDVVEVHKHKDVINLEIRKEFLYNMTPTELKQIQKIIKGMKNENKNTQ